MDTCRYESEITRRCRESTQNHPTMSRHAWNCLELLRIAGGGSELFFLSYVNYHAQIHTASHVSCGMQLLWRARHHR